jgi:hypothetical protein
MQRKERAMVDPSGFDWAVVYHALIYSIHANTGYGFANNEQGHLAYRVGAETGRSNFSDYGDSEDHNGLYKMLKEISEKYGPVEDLPVINNWQDFCRLAVSGYEADMRRKGQSPS